MGKIIDLTGQQFKRLTVTALIGRQHGEAFWLCKCSCGNQTRARGSYLRSGAVTSCGCRQTEQRITHGHTVNGDSGAYKSWENMIQRCTNPRHHHWAKYGGAGITVCERWMSFENFLADMGNRPDETSIDRINNSGNYEPGNCRWAGRKQQQRNRSAIRSITWKGETLSMIEWSEKLQINYSALEARIRRGWPLSKALTAPNRIYAPRKSRRLSGANS